MLLGLLGLATALAFLATARAQAGEDVEAVVSTSAAPTVARLAPKEERRRLRKEQNARTDYTEILVVDPETGLQRVESREPLKPDEEKESES